MKKILIVIIFLALPFMLYAQLTGSGTFADPWSGTLAGNDTWSGTKYINGDIIIDNEKLTISAGAILIFLSETADLRITGTGQLEADGTSGSMIRFTSDDDNDGSYGETGERWGHITFESMGSAGSSLLDYCIIEYCDVSSTLLLPANPNQYGGAIHANFSNLTISNCELLNNKAGWGGGVFVGNGKNPLISNCNIHDNTSTTAGGGLYLWTDSYSTVINCLITYNLSTGSGGGGGVFLGGMAKDVKIINTVISNNLAPQQAYGHNIRFNNNTNSIKPKFINSIIWSPANSIIYVNGGSALAADFENCAIQSPPITYTNCITLDAVNNNITGPNFVDLVPPVFDWSVSFASPCRDAGITPSPAAPNDYAGNYRIGPYDIGAYEVQYSRWRTDASDPTSWLTAGNWEQGLYPGIAGTSGQVVIPSLTNATYAPDISGTITIDAGKSLILEAGAKATFGTLANNGTLKLNSAYPYINVPASLIVNTYTKGGGATEEIQLPLEGGGKKSPVTYKWHYISSPVTSLPVSTFAPTYTLNVAQWVQSRPATSLTQGWVAYDGYIYSTGGMGGETFSNLTPGKGYNFFDTQDNIFTFSGQLNTGDVNATLSYTTGDDLLYGYNLIGNPFSSGLDWDYIIANSFPLNTTKSLYFTRWSALCTYINGVGVPGDVNGIIPPMQGFFSKTYSAGNTIVLAAAARTHNNIHPTYKGSKGLIPLVRLALTDDTLSDEMVVRFDDNAKSYLDNDFDAVKLFMDPDLSTIYSSLGGTDYAINGLPFPESILEVPVNVNLVTEATSKTITASQLQGLENYTVTLTDLSTGFIANLKTTPVVTFAAAKGTITDRFILKVSLITTDIETPVATNNKFNIYSGNNSINIQTIADEWDGHTGDVRVLDLTGKTISDLRNTEFSINSLTQVAAPGAKGLYVVEIRAGVMRYVGKVVVR